MSEQLADQIIHYFEESGTHPLSVQELEEIFEMTTADEFKDLVKTLNTLEETGRLVRTRKNRFGLPEKMNLFRGRIEMNKKDFAFLILDDENMDNVYIHSSDLNTAMHNYEFIIHI